MPLLKSIFDFINADKTVYSHRNRTMEMVAEEQNLDIDQIKAETYKLAKKEGAVTAVIKLRKQFHVTSAAAWIFVDRLNQ